MSLVVNLIYIAVRRWSQMMVGRRWLPGLFLSFRLPPAGNRSLLSVASHPLGTTATALAAPTVDFYLAYLPPHPHPLRPQFPPFRPPNRHNVADERIKKFRRRPENPFHRTSPFQQHPLFRKKAQGCSTVVRTLSRKGSVDIFDLSPLAPTQPTTRESTPLAHAITPYESSGIPISTIPTTHSATNPPPIETFKAARIRTNLDTRPRSCMPQYLWMVHIHQITPVHHQ